MKLLNIPETEEAVWDGRTKRRKRTMARKQRRRKRKRARQTTEDTSGRSV